MSDRETMSTVETEPTTERFFQLVARRGGELTQTHSQVIYQQMAAVFAASRSQVIRDPQGWLGRVVAHVLGEPSAVVTSTPELSPARIGSLREVIDTLPAEQRAILVLHRRDSMGYEEIAETLGISRHRVQTGLAEALRLCVRQHQEWVMNERLESAEAP